jgi:hypothetical protein
MAPCAQEDQELFYYPGLRIQNNDPHEGNKQNAEIISSLFIPKSLIAFFKPLMKSTLSSLFVLHPTIETNPLAFRAIGAKLIHISAKVT